MAWITGKRGAFRVQWRDGGRGSPIQSSKCFPDRSAAEAELRDVQARQGRRKALSGPITAGQSIETLLERWGASAIAEGRARAPWVTEATGHVLAICKELGWKHITEITAEGLDRWQSKRPGGTGTTKPIAALKSWLRWCNAVLRIPVDDYVLKLRARKPKPKAQAPLLTRDQVERIYQRAMTIGGRSCATLVEHLALFGCRPIDVSRLQVKDWDGAHRLITYRNTKNRTDVGHVVQDAHARKLDALTRGRQPEEPLFLNVYGEPWALDKRGAATKLSAWYFHNIGDELVIRRETDGTEVGWLEPSQRGIYILKDYAMSLMNRLAGGDLKRVIRVSGHRTLQAAERYLGTNSADAAALVDAIPVIADDAEPSPP